MARLEVEMPEDLFDSLEMSEERLEQLLLSGALELQNAMQKTVNETTSDNATGEAAKSIKATKPKKAKTGAWIVNIRPTGYSNTRYVRKTGKSKRIYPVSNALKLIWLQYGRAGQRARPWLERATQRAEKAVTDAMQAAYERMTGNGPE